jgi:hypothetical protein
MNYQNIKLGKHFYEDNMEGIVSRTLRLDTRLNEVANALNALYTERANIPHQPVQVGDTAICSECLQEKIIVHLFGGKYPHCSTCDTEIRN